MLFLLHALALAADPATEVLSIPRPGDVLPAFDLRDQHGQPVARADLAGRTVWIEAIRSGDW